VDGRRAARALKPRVLVGGVVDDQLGDDPDPAIVRLGDETPHVVERPVCGVNPGVVGDVVAVVAQRRGKEGQEPQRGDAEILQVVELARQALEIADAVIRAVEERLDVELIDDGVFVPERIGGLR